MNTTETAAAIIRILRLHGFEAFEKHGAVWTRSYVRPAGHNAWELSKWEPLKSVPEALVWLGY